LIWLKYIQANSKYLKHVLDWTFAQIEIRNGSAYSALTIEKLKKFSVCVPPLNEQHRIVTAIESAFAVIDEIEQAKTDLKTAVERSKQKILSLAITGKLVPQDPADEPASVLLQRIRAEREQLVKAGKIKRGKGEKAAPVSVDNSYYAGLPAGWAVCGLESLFAIVGGGTPSTGNDDYWGEGIPWFSSADIDDSGCVMPRRSVTPLGIANSTTNVVPVGSVIVVTRVGLGKVAVLNERMCFSQDNQALIPKFDGIADSHYIYHFIYNEMQSMKHSGRGTTILGITKKQLADIDLWLPPLTEQQRIVAAIEAAFEQLDNIAATLE
jgi:type I restriction enzyme S subunit